MTADPSPAAAAARAAALARATGARIVLLHVVWPEAALIDWPGLQQNLAPLLEGVTVQPLQRHGPPAREILAVAREHKADLIVMTRHGRWISASELGFPRFLLHSMLCSVLLDAACPVWVEPESAAPAPINRVVCGVASLVHDQDTITRAAAIGDLLQARLTLFRSALKAAIAVPGQQQRTLDWQRDVVTAVRGDLGTLRDTMGIAADLDVGIGVFADALLNHAHATDLLTVRRTSRDWGKDETLHPLVRGAPSPVLVTPGAPPRVAARPVRAVRMPMFARVALLMLGLLMGFWLMQSAFTAVRHPDMCADHPYGCAFQESWKKAKGARPKEPEPLVSPSK